MRTSKVFMVLVCVLMFSAVALGSVAADEVGEVTHDVQLLGYMGQIAEDIEEIHHDMHKVAFALRLSAYSHAAIAVILLAMLGLKISGRKG